MNLYQVTIALLLFCFLEATYDDVDGNLAHFTDDIVSINCGSTGTSSAALDRKEWHGDVLSKYSSLLQMKGSSTASTLLTHKPVSADDPVPYGTARLSRSPFSYSVRLNPGQKILRFHFNPILYKGSKRFKDLFNLEVCRFTLLSNFSASVTAFNLDVNSFVKEYCLNIEENQEIKMVFSPASCHSFDAYAFVNGIEIISVPATLSYFQGGGIGVQVVGKSLVYVDNSTALEVIRRLNLKQDSISSVGGIKDMFGVWEMVSKQKVVEMNNVTWKTSVDVGFRYLVRLHFSEVKLKIAENSGITFEVSIGDMISSLKLDILRERDDHWYRDYIVMMTGQKEEGKRDLLICLKSNEEFMNGYGALEGFEIMKLSNSDNSLASPSPWPSVPASSHWTILNLYQVLGHKNMIATVAITSLALINIIFYTLCKVWEARGAKEKNMPPIKVGRLCRRISLAEIQLATGNFYHEHLLGRGGFGNVYKGLIGKGQETVAIKRLKSNSRQGVQEFLAEVETLTQLRHVNLVTLVGYCAENGELILVYEYMARGTLADHIFGHTSDNDNQSPLTWKQRLEICIGAGRGLEYLHTGNSIIHRDVKASNILLDENFIAKVSDFGLAKHANFSKLDSHVSTKVKGTFGYFDPSYFSTGRLTSKSDVYAFGVVLLEVLSGRPATRLLVSDEQSLIMWAQENISNGKADQIVVSNLKGKITEDSLKTFVEIAERCLHSEPKKRPTMAQVVLQLQLSLTLQESFTSLIPNERTTDADLTTTPAKHEMLLRQENLLGFEDTTKTLIRCLTEETQQLDVISIIGMPGLGKTTLAEKIFHDPAIQCEFPIRIWVNVSELTKREVYLTILYYMFYRGNYEKQTDQELALLTANNLKREKFLIVLDDVQTTKDWDEVLIFLPKSNKISKVLITCRDMEVALHANNNRDPHKLRCLSAEESWLLLRLEAFGKPECSPELEVYGKLIAEQCDGLPLAIKIIGGILVKKFIASDGIDSRKESWRKVYNQVNAYLVHNLERSMEKIILFSYNKLPLHLRSCFLYFAMFPRDSRIQVSKLIRMWIAEGFILQKTGINLEEIAEKYLEDLIQRNLIRVAKIKVCGGNVKSCYIDGMLWDFCKFQAGYERENFLQEIKQSTVGVFQPQASDIKKYHRLCVHSNVLNFISYLPYAPCVCSFVCYSKEDFELPSEYSSVFPAAFKRIRVLDIKPIKFINKIPSEFYQLVHLSYLVLSIDFAVLPASFSKLWNLQTLIVYTQSRTLEMKADIWKLIHLRHLVTYAMLILPKTSKTSTEESYTLQTLCTLSPQSCTKEVFMSMPNLKKLGIRGRLSLLFNGKTGSFDSLGTLSNLEKLKLQNDVFPFPPSEGKLRGLPPHYKFPPNLRSLTLACTYLDWNYMSIIGLLQNLEVLKLKENAFMGSSWRACDGGFRHLQVLHIEHTDLVVWEAAGHHFPRLRLLELQNCEELREVPIGLADIPSLRLLDLYRTSHAAASAKRIFEEKEKKREGKHTTNINLLKLSIFPPVE